MDNLKTIAENVVEIAKEWQEKIIKFTTSSDRHFQNKILKMIEKEESKAIVVELLDRSFRSSLSSNVNNALISILSDKKGDFLQKYEAILLDIYLNFGKYFPKISTTLIKKKVKKDAYSAVIPFERLIPHIQKRKKNNITSNVNELGEVILGEEEAKKKLQQYISLLKNPEINYVSIKISNVFSQLHPLGYDNSLKILKERLIQIYREARNSNASDKFVNLDMEEYKDSKLTIEMFKEVLSLPEFNDFYAGIVLQAYLPDSYFYLQDLTQFAIKRIEEGKSPIKIRLVKGANLEIERVESSIKEWENPIFPSKLSTDANYKKMLLFAIQPVHLKAVRLGVASHNLFDIAFAHLLTKKVQCEDYISFEMLEGMSQATVDTIRTYNKNQDFILYTPTAKDEHFLNAISYLIRRLDENTGKDNFLRHSLFMKVGDTSWQFLEKQFLDSIDLIDKIENKPRRKQNRLEEKTSSLLVNSPYVNEADTDWHIPNNLKWAEKIIKNYSKFDKPIKIPAICGKKERIEGNKLDFYSFLDKSQIIYEYYLNNEKDILKILDNAHKFSKWENKTNEERHLILSKIADKFREKRGFFIGLMAHITGKMFMESDTEISEGVDFAEYYARGLYLFDRLENIEISAKGTVLVISPWNFPFAIPAGGVLAALATGNTVILKPAPESAPISYEMAKCFWESGVPKECLQICFCEEGELLQTLTSAKTLKHIIFTGGTNTAINIQKNNPFVDFSAETGGKNVTIVTADSDWDQAIKNVTNSAFGNAGQKCSATSILLLEDELFYSKKFKSQLIDSVKSFSVGNPFELHKYMGPLIAPPNGNLKHAIENLENDEKWALKPEFLNNDQRYLTPSIKWNVTKDSFTFKNELFGPLLAVTRVSNLKEAVQLANSTGYGLTSGLESLNKNEQAYWKENIIAGNLYINRPTTGAIVQRQPFGGMRNSAFGKGIKAGGPNYITQFVNITNKKITKATTLPQFILNNFAEQILDKESLLAYQYSINSYLEVQKDYFSKSWDVSMVIGEDNELFYIPCRGIILRIEKNDEYLPILLILGAAHITKTEISISLTESIGKEKEENIKAIAKLLKVVVHQFGTEEFYTHLSDVERLRLCSKENFPDKLYVEAAKHKTTIISSSPYYEGRVELLNYLQEVSISDRFHRYGNLGLKEYKYLKSK